MTKLEKESLLTRFLDSAKTLCSYCELSSEQLDFRPFPEAWTIREQLVHLGESEICSFHRYRKAIGEVGAPVVGYAEEKFTRSEGLDYANEDPEVWVDILISLRKIVVAHLRRQTDKNWDDFFYMHNESGKTTLTQYLNIYINHIRVHSEFIQRNLKAFNA